MMCGLRWLVMLVCLWPVSALANLCDQAEKSPDGAVALVAAISGTGVKGVRACAYIAAPVTTVYGVMTDYPSMPRWIDKLKKINVRWLDAESAIVSYEISTLFGAWRYTQRRIHTKNRNIRFVAVGGDLKSIEGQYEFRPVAGRPTASYFYLESFVDPGQHIPEFIVSYFREKATRRLIEDIRSESTRRTTGIKPH